MAVFFFSSPDLNSILFKRRQQTKLFKHDCREKRWLISKFPCLLDEFSSHRLVLPALSLPLLRQGGIEQRSATTSLPPHLYQVRRGSVPYPSPPCKGQHVPWVIRGSLCCLSLWLTCMRRESLCYSMNKTSLMAFTTERWVQEREKPTSLQRCFETVTPHKTWPAVPLVAWGTGPRSGTSSHLPPGSWIREGSDMKHQLS